MTPLQLTPEQEAEARKIAALVQQASQDEILQIARLLVSKPDHPLLGATEFEVRDRVHRSGAKAIETTLQERNKRGPKAPAGPAPPAATPPRFTTGGPNTR